MQYVALFFGGVFFANALPHLVAGVSGVPLQTPFASPPFRGLSSPVVNVLWSLVNLGVAYVLAVRLAGVGSDVDLGVAFGGFAAGALLLARAFARVRADNPQP
ncbi:MAG: hypothetical protein KC583_01530 [Myxococcales bacterium]|nr:hypothetical protein [Myxococcales bacterium]